MKILKKEKEKRKKGKNFFEEFIFRFFWGETDRIKPLLVSAFIIITFFSIVHGEIAVSGALLFAGYTMLSQNNEIFRLKHKIARLEGDKDDKEVVCFYMSGSGNLYTIDE